MEKYVWILVDKDSIIKCMSSQEVNLHKDKLHMDKYHVEDTEFVCGDYYNASLNIVESRPENHVVREEDTVESLIRAKTREIAIQALISEGVLASNLTIKNKG